MDGNTYKSLSKKYKNKRWSDAEVVQMLNYIIKTGNFEAPTAHIYYEDMLNETNLDARWDMAKWKMRHLKYNYQKACELQNSNTLEDYESRDVYKTCRHFDLLAQIFGTNSKHEKFEVFETSSSQNFSENMLNIIETTETSDHDIEDLASTSPSDDDNDSTLLEEMEIPLTSAIDIKPTQVGSSQLSEVNNKVTKTSTNSKMPTKTYFRQPNESLTATKSSTDNTDSCQCKRFKFMQQKMDLEKRKIDLEEYKFKCTLKADQKRADLEELKLKRSLKYDEKRADLEEFKIKRELELEEKKLKQNMLLKQLQIEKEERVAKYEIDMKYKNN